MANESPKKDRQTERIAELYELGIVAVKGPHLGWVALSA